MVLMGNPKPEKVAAGIIKKKAVTRSLSVSRAITSRTASIASLRNVPFRGQIWVLFTGAVLFLLCMLGVGLLISTVSVTQQQALVTSFFFIMPAVTFSGFGFPISTMPQWLQYLTYLSPLRYFLVVLRGTYLKGVGMEILWPQMVAMAALGLGLLTLSIFRFHKALD